MKKELKQAHNILAKNKDPPILGQHQTKKHTKYMKYTISSCILTLAFSGLSSASDTLASQQAAPVETASFQSMDEEEFLKAFRLLVSTTGSDQASVANLVKTFNKAFPAKSRIIYVSALALAPDAHDQIMAAYYDLVPNAGTGFSDAKGAKGGKGNDVGNGNGDDGNDVASEDGDIMSFPAGENGSNNPGGTVGGTSLSNPTGGPGAFPINGGSPILPSGNPGGGTPVGQTPVTTP